MITLSTGALYPYGLDRIFEIAQKAGYDGVELLLRLKGSDAYLDSWDAEYLKKLETRYGIKVLSLHVPFSFEEDQSIYPEIKELAEKLDAKYIIIHSPREDQTSCRKWIEDNVENGDINKGSTVSILIENLETKKAKADPVYMKPEQFQRFSQVCFDTAHSLRSGQDPKVFMEQLSNIKQLHLSNWDGIDDHLSILKDKNRFSELLSLKPIENICLELCPKAFNDIKDQEEIVSTLKETLAFVKQYSKA